MGKDFLRIALILCVLLFGGYLRAASIIGLEWDSQNYFTRLVLTTDDKSPVVHKVNNRIANDGYFYIDVYNITTPYLHRVIDVSDKSIMKIDAIPYVEHGVLRLVVYVRNQSTTYDVKTVSNPERLVIDVVPPDNVGQIAGMPIGKNQAYLIRDNTDTSMESVYIGNSGVKEFSLPDIPQVQNSLQSKSNSTGKRKVVIIDAGHGGGDTGAVGSMPNRSQQVLEKDLTLQFAYALKKCIDASPNMVGIMTRTNDKRMALSDRVKFAEEKQGDFFISVHMNDASNSDARGMEIYFLSEKGTAQSNLELEKKENEEIGDMNFFRNTRSGILNNILSDLRKASLESLQWESFEVCKQIITKLQKVSFYRLNNRGIKSANFYVLKNKQMPAVLLEVGFISNREDIMYLVNPRFQALTAQVLTKSISSYFSQTETKK